MTDIERRRAERDAEPVPWSEVRELLIGRGWIQPAPSEPAAVHRPSEEARALRERIEEIRRFSATRCAAPSPGTGVPSSTRR